MKIPLLTHCHNNQAEEWFPWSLAFNISTSTPSLALLFEEVERDLKIEILNAMGIIGGEISRFLSDGCQNEGHNREAAADALALASTEDTSAFGQASERGASQCYW
jgi:hypothetical protein